MLRRRWFALRAVCSFGEAGLALRIFLVASAIRLIFRLPLPRVQSVLEPRLTPTAADPIRVERIVAIVTAVLEAGRPLIRRGCLTRGATLYYFLRRAGLDVQLSFGMDDTGAVGGGQLGMVGHCWLVKDGVPYLEARDPRQLYTEVYRLPVATWRAA